MSAKILFVDDEIALEKLIVRQFRKQIRNQEFEFVFAHNGVEALQQLPDNHDVDVVLTDINMPEMNGLTLLDKLVDVYPTVKTVVLTAYSDMKNIRTAMNRGAFDFLTKPIDFQDLEITINRALSNVQQIRDNQQKLQEAQTQLIQSEKMSALGQLIAGVAHEINNPIGFIDGNLLLADDAIQEIMTILNMYREKFPDPGPEIVQKIKEVDLDYLLNDMSELLSSMKEGTDRIHLLSKSLRTFSRSDFSSKVEFNIHEGIDSTLLILKHRLKGNETRPPIEICKAYGNLPLVECYPGQLNQVFMNLIANAIDALDEWSLTQTYEEILNNPNIITIQTELKSEEVTIKPQIESTASFDEEDEDLEPPIFNDDDLVLETEEVTEILKVLIRIKDNGPGIPEEVRRRVFDHLFTTKAVGKGTGLGLSISRQIVEEKHGGKISCVSTPGEGAEFIIEIPVSTPMLSMIQGHGA